MERTEMYNRINLFFKKTIIIVKVLLRHKSDWISYYKLFKETKEVSSGNLYRFIKELRKTTLIKEKIKKNTSYYQLTKDGVNLFRDLVKTYKKVEGIL